MIINKFENHLAFSLCIMNRFTSFFNFKSKILELTDFFNIKFEFMNKYVIKYINEFIIFSSTFFSDLKIFNDILSKSNINVSSDPNCSSYFEEFFEIEFIEEEIQTELSENKQIDVIQKKGILNTESIKKSLYFKASSQFSFSSENIKLNSFHSDSNLVSIHKINKTNDILEVELNINLNNRFLHLFSGEIQISSENIIYIYGIKIDFRNLKIISTAKKTFVSFIFEYLIFIFALIYILIFLFKLLISLKNLRNEFNRIFNIIGQNVSLKKKKQVGLKNKKYVKKIFDGLSKKITKILSNLKDFSLIIEFILNKKSNKITTINSHLDHQKFSVVSEINCYKQNKQFCFDLESHQHFFNNTELIKHLLLDERISKINCQKDHKPQMLMNVLKKFYKINKKKMKFRFSLDKGYKKYEVMKTQKRKASYTKDKKTISDHQSIKIKRNISKIIKTSKLKNTEMNYKKNIYLKNLILLEKSFFETISDKKFYYKGYPLYEDNDFYAEDCSMIYKDPLFDKITQIQRGYDFDEDDKIINNPYITIFKKYNKELICPNYHFDSSNTEKFLPNFLFYKKKNNRFKKYWKNFKKKNPDYKIDELTFFSSESETDMKSNLEENLSEVKKSTHDNSWIGYFQQNEKLNATISKMNETQSFSIEKNLVDLMDQPEFQTKSPNEKTRKTKQKKNKSKSSKIVSTSDDEYYGSDQKNKLELNDIFKNFKIRKIKYTEEFYGLPEKISEEENSQEEETNFQETTFKPSIHQYSEEEKYKIIKSTKNKTNKILDDQEMNPNNVPFINPKTFENSEYSQDKVNTSIKEKLKKSKKLKKKIKRNRNNENDLLKNEFEMLQRNRKHNFNIELSDSMTVNKESEISQNSYLAFKLEDEISSKTTNKYLENVISTENYIRKPQTRKVTSTQSYFLNQKHQVPNYSFQSMNHWMMSTNNSNLNRINNSTQIKTSESHAKKKSKKLKERFKEKPNKQINQHQFMINNQSNMIHQSNMIMKNQMKPLILQNNLSYPYANIKNHYKAMYPSSFYNQPVNFYPPSQNIYDYYMTSNNLQNNKKAHKRSKNISDNSKRDGMLIYSQNNTHTMMKDELNMPSSENEEKIIAMDSSEEKIENEQSTFSQNNFNVSPQNIMHTPTYFNNEQFTHIQYSPNDNIYSLNKMKRQIFNQNLSPMNHFINYENNLNSSDEIPMEERSENNQIYFKNDNEEDQYKMKYFMDDLSNHSSKDHLDENKMNKYLEFIYQEDDKEEVKTPSPAEYTAKSHSVSDDDDHEELNCFLDKKSSEEFLTDHIISSKKKIDNLPVIERIKKRNKKSSED